GCGAAAARLQPVAAERMVFRILAELEVEEGGRAVALGGARQRAVLTNLLLHVGEVVSAARLIDDLYGSHRPATAAKPLQARGSRSAAVERPSPRCTAVLPRRVSRTDYAPRGCCQSPPQAAGPRASMPIGERGPAWWRALRLRRAGRCANCPRRASTRIEPLT